MTCAELKSTFRELKCTSPKEDLTAHFVFTEDGFAKFYPLLSRTCAASSDNRAFCAVANAIAENRKVLHGRAGS